MDSREELIARLIDEAANYAAKADCRIFTVRQMYVAGALAALKNAREALSTPSPEAPMSEHTISVLSDGQDHEEIYFDGKNVMGTNHDEHGWSGMEVVRNFAEKLAELAGWKYVEGDLPVEGGTDAPE